MKASPGWAGQPAQLDRLLAYLPANPLDAEPACCIADAWVPPEELALPLEVCDRVTAAAAGSQPVGSGNGSYYFPDLAPEDEAGIVERFAAANDLWWRLDIDEWVVGVKRYLPGERHPEHQDLHPSASRRKLAGVVQLSDPVDYAGGQLVMRFGPHAEVMPAALGSLIAFPGWTCHEVQPITAGQRWSLCVNGWGNPLH